MIPAARRRGAFGVGLVVLAAAIAAAGAAVGAWIDWTWWNPVYGMQVIVFGAALLIAVLGIIAYGHGPFGRAFGVSSVALLVGIVGGMAFGGPPAIADTVGTMTLRLERPIELVDSGEAGCQVVGSGEQLSVQRQTGPVPIDGRPFLIAGRPYLAVSLTVGDMFASDSERRDDRLELMIMVDDPGPYADEEGARGGEFVSTRDSALEGRLEGASGSLDFAKLDGWAYSGPNSSVENLDLQGTIEWTCPSE